ncbi:MAG: response regulator [Clostridia bacterium]|nr:response regulator [Clostridia bacterium]
MCYSMIIVDDERIIREGLKKFIQKLDCGFCVQEIFEDGKEAIEYLQVHPVDLVITDICMNEVNGLEVAEYVQGHLPDTEMLILSGYRDFEYAQQAMSCGVTRYLLKPVKNAEIVEILDNVRRRLDEKKRLKNVLFQYDELLDQARKQFFVDFMLGAATMSEDGDSIFQTLNFKYPANEIYSSVLHIHWPEKFFEEIWKCEKNRIQTAVLNFFSSRDNHVFAMVTEKEKFLIFSATDTVAADINNLRRWTKETFRTDVDVQIIFTCKGLEGLKDYKLSMQENVPQNTVENERRMLLCTYLNLGMYKQGRELFLELSDSAENTEAEAEKLIRLICEKAYKAGEQIDCERYCRHLHNGFQTPEEVFDSFCEYFCITKNEDELITKIKEYVQANYAMDISLESVAAKVYLHPVYLSRFFKQHVGENFSDYLFRVRMTNAITLLKSNRYKIYEISRMVGYKSSKYFSKQFKNYTGYIPKNYCRIMWGINAYDD